MKRRVPFVSFIRHNLAEIMFYGGFLVLIFGVPVLWWMTSSDYDRGWGLVYMWPAIVTIVGVIALLLALWLLLLVWRVVRWAACKLVSA